MHFIIPFCHKDARLAEKLCAWIGELGGVDSRHQCLLLAAKATPAELRKPVLDQARASLGCQVEMAETATANEKGWPESCNHLFYSAAARMRKLGVPFLWLEPDCTPLRKSWLDEIEAAYLVAKKPYMGFIFSKPWPHLTGCAVYPSDLARYNGISLLPQKRGGKAMPWDVVNAGATLKHTHSTNLILHEWGENDAPEFPDAKSLERIPKEAALFHRCKSGSLIDRLRERCYPDKPSLIERATDAVAKILRGANRERSRCRTITVVAATSLNGSGHAKAIEWTASLIPHPVEKLLLYPEPVPGFTGKWLPLPEPWAKNGRWRLQDMADFMLRGLHRYIETDVAIVVHDDGYALNDKWTDEFLDWDYIGAPWPSHFSWVKRGRRVGNGGFSLRSKRWLERASSLSLPKNASEDMFSCIAEIQHFARANCRVAPLDVAMQWSFEHAIEEFPNWTLKDSFGFHGRKVDASRTLMVL